MAEEIKMPTFQWQEVGQVSAVCVGLVQLELQCRTHTAVYKDLLFPYLYLCLAFILLWFNTESHYVA